MQNDGNDQCEEEEDIINACDSIVIKKADKLALIQLTNKFQCILWSKKLDLKNVVGKRYWSIFKLELTDQKQQRSYTLTYCDNPDEIEIKDVVDSQISNPDNRELVDDNKSQRLSRNNIKQMKESGISSGEIIKSLVENSETFSKKTAYSQEKYLNRKTSKHTEYVQILKPTLRLLTEIYEKRKSHKSPATIPFDMLSNIVGSVNTLPNGRYILYEDGYQGIVMAALLTYIGPDTKVYNVITREYSYDKHAIQALKFDKMKLRQIVNIDSLLDKQSHNNNAKNGDDDGDDDNVGVDDSRDEGNKNYARKKFKKDNKTAKRIAGIVTNNAALSIKDKTDGLIVISKGIPNKIVKKLLNYVKPSRPFVIYSKYMSVLSDLYFELKQQGKAINIRLCESFLRSYQVIDGRTRPKSTMSGSSGFLLTGVLVEH